MIDDGNGWISDSSGERRPDWRDSYVVVWVAGSNDGGDGKGKVEVWNRYDTTLREETIIKIEEALKEVGIEGGLVSVGGKE